MEVAEKEVDQQQIKTTWKRRID